VSHVARRRRGAVVAVLVIAIVVIAAPRGTALAAAVPEATIPTPLSTSVSAASGTWVTLPMGRLNQPLNTFWQLFFRPNGSPTWSNEVEATATATNGGLVLASSPGAPLIAAVRPTHLLHFSPLISTTDGGHSWSDGIVPKGLANSPGALSVASDGRALALVNEGLAAQVLVNTGSLSTWRTLTTARHLGATAPGRVCGVRSLTAVVSLAGDAIVGGQCSRAGVVGIFAQLAGTWRLAPLTLTGDLHADHVEVLSLAATTTGVSALLGATSGAGITLVAAWTTGTAGWSTSQQYAVASHSRLVSFGPAGATGMFALSATAVGTEHLAVIDGADNPWQVMSPPPPSTETVAFGPAGSPVDALAVRGKEMTVWSLLPAGTQWVKSQVVSVKIEYGSSS
jgi:hypothetical protein